MSPRHDYGQLQPGDGRAALCEAWRFPVVDTHGGDGSDRDAAYALNDVTFVHAHEPGARPGDVGVVGTFANLYDPIPLREVRFGGEPTRYRAVTVVVPKGQVHTYKFIVDSIAVVDPVNPQVTMSDGGRRWSRFFTQECTVPIVLEHWERVLLDRLTDHILPFRTREGRNFLDRYYSGLDRAARDAHMRRAYRLDESVGVVNFIDKLLAREEAHHLVDYRLCLELIDQVLRRRNPFVEPAEMPRDMFVDLYREMASGTVAGWDYGRYGSPRYFLQLLRRHTFTGAFSHPKYGGNAGAAGWAYLEERYRSDGATMFDWRRSIEAPLGNNTDYRG